MSDISNEQKGYSQKCIETKGTLQMGLMYIIPETAPKRLTSENTFSNFLLIVDAYLKKYLWYRNYYY